MFCFQCEQADRGSGCTERSTCGKSPEVAALQDLLIHSLKGLALVAREARGAGIVDREADGFTMSAVFATLTNVNFDAVRFQRFIHEAVAHRRRLQAALGAKGVASAHLDGSAAFEPAPTLEALIAQGEAVGIPAVCDVDVRSLQETLVYGVKGLAAYAAHAWALGAYDAEVVAFIHEALASTLDTTLTTEARVALLLRCGEVNLRVLAMLDTAHNEHFGAPEPTPVTLGHRRGKAILVSGHDLHVLGHLLAQTEGKGIDVYTHGEMLPAHGYPGLKKRFPHLYGHYGTAWQNQIREFTHFPGAILMTTNCLIQPRETYAPNLFTTNEVGWSGIAHAEGTDFSAVIERARALPGFADDEAGTTVLVGFGHKAVLGLAGTIIDAVKSGAIRHFFLVGGCDGAKPGRNYYTEFVEKTPTDTVVLTLACGKFRFFDQDLGTIGGIPRLIDVGQCNDAYSAVKIAQALADAFGCGVNDLPLTLVVSWFEQKAVAVLLTLLHLGIRGIRLGPTLPAFVSPNVLRLLVENFDLRANGTVDADLEEALAR
ncbi:MAG: hydroxylamine reductase [Acidobacteria bacterium]|nr:hydroxylamine reductase [Acidobacteriota bacterium]